jgi:hypothetical protein
LLLLQSSGRRLHHFSETAILRLQPIVSRSKIVRDRSCLCLLLWLRLHWWCHRRGGCSGLHRRGSCRSSRWRGRRLLLRCRRWHGRRDLRNCRSRLYQSNVFNRSLQPIVRSAEVATHVDRRCC